MYTTDKEYRREQPNSYANRLDWNKLQMIKFVLLYLSHSFTYYRTNKQTLSNGTSKNYTTNAQNNQKNSLTAD